MGVEHSSSTPSFSVETSVIQGTSEVQVMRRALRQRETAFIFPYELLQNSMDYHKYSADNPSDLPYVICVMPDGRRILSSDLADEAERPSRIEFHNKIDGETGLNPYQVANLGHDAQTKKTTLGKHGRGGTIAAAAGLIDGHVSSIDYVSRTVNTSGEVYNWRGKGVMGVSDPLHQLEPRLIINCEYLDEDVTETVVGIDHPDQMVVDALKTISDFFLPANPKYAGCRLKGAEGVAKIPNLMSVAYRKVEGEKGDDPKVEILPDEVVGRISEETTAYIYEGGLRLREWSGKYALNWSFYGFGEGTRPYGYNPSRSRDSTGVDGSAKGLIAVTLTHCDNPEIFLRILRDCVEVKKEEYCAEANILASQFTNLSPKTQAALLSAWSMIIKEKGLSEGSLITQDEGVKARLEAEGKKAILVKSNAFSEELIQALGLPSATEALGIREVATSTGESMMYTRGDLEKHKEEAVLDLMRYMSKSNAIFDKDTGTIFVPGEVGATISFSGKFTDLPASLRTFAENYLSAGGALKVTINNTVFEVEMRGAIRAGAEASLSIKKGELTHSVNGVKTEMIDSHAIGARIRRECLEMLRERIGRYIKSDGTIDWEEYKAGSSDVIAEIERRTAEEKEKFIGELEAIRRQIEEAQRELREKALTTIEVAETAGHQRLSSRARSALSLPKIVRSAAVTLLFASLGLGTVGVTSVALNRMGVRIPGVELPSNTVNIGGLKVEVPIRKTQMEYSGGRLLPRFEDRLPDSISASDEAIAQPLPFADIVRLPKGQFNKQDGEAIGFFPVEQFVYGKPLGAQKQELTPFNSVVQVENLDEAAKTLQGDDILVYKPRFLYQSLYAPVGFEITTIYQVGGKAPMVNKSHALFWENGKDVPSQIMVVARRAKEEKLTETSGRIRSYGNISPLGEYNPKFDIAQATQLNDRLKGDPKLQLMHRNFLQEMILWQMNGGEDKKAVSGIVIKYLNRFAAYSDTRDYGLKFQINKHGGSFDSLISIADDPEGKYFCSVASNVTKELLASVGITAANQPGMPLYNVGGVLYVDDTHQNNVVYLPDGRFLLVDNTPFFKGTPSTTSAGETITGAGLTLRQKAERVNTNFPEGSAYMPQKLVRAEEVAERVELWKEMAVIAVEGGVSLTGIALSFFALRKLVPALRRREAKRRIEESVKANGLTNIEFRLLSAIEDHLANTGAETPKEFEGVSQRYLDLMLQFDLNEHGPALQWLTENPEGIRVIFQENRILDMHEAFARVASGYEKRVADIEDRFPPVLRTEFLDTARGTRSSRSYVPPDFQLLYNLAVLINTREQSHASSSPERVEVINSVIQRELAVGSIGESKMKMVNALYEQLTGRSLKNVLKSNTGEEKK